MSGSEVRERAEVRGWHNRLSVDAPRSRALSADVLISDRPERIVGHLTAAQFVDGWGQGQNSFLEDPPNAVLSFLEEGNQTPEDVVVTLTNPRLENGDLTYSATLVEGELPASSGACSLFIDPIGRPLSPVSVMGVRRRQRRRIGRRI